MNRRVGPVAGGGSQRWIVLQIVRPGIGVATIIGCHEARGLGATKQIDADAGIRENGVAENGVVDVRGGCDLYSLTIATAWRNTVEGDNVALSSARAANGVANAAVAGVINYGNSRPVIAQRLSACHIRANEVALDEIARAAGHIHTIDAITRDQIPRRRARRSCGSADDIVVCRDRDAETP